ncbi:MAG: shikimate kinase [Odoribacter sp.]|nr:shikimate kinase [Odoribacter sp.]
MSAGRRVYITGFMGSGKSTAGRKLAAALGWQFIDLDKEIELKTGRSVKEIFSDSGEDHFRELESGTLLSLKTPADTVISAGGGTPCYGSNMDFMIRTGLVVYLKLTPGQLKNRLEATSASRPLIENISKADLLTYISDKLSEREIYYLKASIITDGINLNIKVLSEAVKNML